MSEPQIVVVVSAPRRRGRPRASIRKSVLTAYVPETYHDRLAQLAIKHDVSVSRVLTQVLQKAFDMPRPERISLQNK